MHPTFSALVEGLHEAHERLLASDPKPATFRWPTERIPGVYLFSEGGHYLYVGRTNNVRNRYGGHHRQSVTDSPFAFRLAREETGFVNATYRTGQGSRRELLADARFRRAYDEAKRRIRAMDFRWVEEPNPVRQCLLEVYVAVVLATPYNDFDNH